MTPSKVSRGHSGAEMRFVLWNGRPFAFWNAARTVPVPEVSAAASLQLTQDAMPETKWVLVVGPSAVTVLQSNQHDLFTGSASAPGGAWLREVRRTGHCVVVAVEVSSLRGGNEQSLIGRLRRSALRGGLTNTVLALPWETNQGRYHKLEPADEFRTADVVIDSSVLIDIEHFYKGYLHRKGAANENRLRQLHSLLAYLTGRRVYCDFALLESSMSRDGNELDWLKLRRVSTVVHSVLAWDLQTLDRVFAASHPPRPAMNKDIAELDGDAMAMWEQSAQWPVLPAYTMFLKLMQLTPVHKKYSGAKDRLNRWLSFVNWMIEELPLLSAREWFIVCDWFLGPTRPASEQAHLMGLLKFQPKHLAKNAWGAAWDMFFVRLLDRDLTAELAWAADADLVTADAHFVKNRERVRTTATLSRRPGTLAYVGVSSRDPSLDQWSSSIEDAFHRVKAWQVDREQSLEKLLEVERRDHILLQYEKLTRMTAILAEELEAPSEVM